MTPALKTILLGQSFTPAKLFGASDLGAWYDPSDYASLYQDQNNTAATAAGQTIGIVVDKRYALVRGSDIIPTGDFSSAAGWTAQTGWTIGGGVATVNSAGAGSTYLRAGTTVAGTWYEITFTVTAYTSGNLFAAAGAATSTAITSVGTYTRQVLAASSEGCGVYASSTNTVATIDNVSARPILGNHAAQVTVGNRPTLNAGGRINYSSGTKSLLTTWGSSLGSACTVARSVPQGAASILTAQTIGTTYTDTTDHCGLVIINRALTPGETALVTRWLNRRAAAA